MLQLLQLCLYVGEKNENHFIVATQDAELQSKLRDIPGQFYAKTVNVYYMYEPFYICCITYVNS